MLLSPKKFINFGKGINMKDISTDELTSIFKVMDEMGDETQKRTSQLSVYLVVTYTRLHALLDRLYDVELSDNGRQLIIDKIDRIEACLSHLQVPLSIYDHMPCKFILSQENNDQ
jgi:ribosome assembly protein YihI (activator of Der GTPase)